MPMHGKLNEFDPTLQSWETYIEWLHGEQDTNSKEKEYLVNCDGTFHVFIDKEFMPTGWLQHKIVRADHSFSRRTFLPKAVGNRTTVQISHAFLCTYGGQCCLCGRTKINRRALQFQWFERSITSVCVQCEWPTHPVPATTRARTHL